MNPADEIQKEHSRIRRAYQLRAEGSSAQLYHWTQPQVFLDLYGLEHTTALLLKREGFLDLSRCSVLDFGCGSGRWLRRLMDWGIPSSQLHGMDLLEERVQTARERSPQIDFQVGGTYPLPYSDGSFDILFAHTVFSSILDPSMRQRVGEELLRILKPDGIILVYDFCISHPKNPDTVGIGKQEMKRIFGESDLSCRSLTLAPPISRRLSRLSPLFSYVTERLVPFLRTHRIYRIRKAGSVETS